MVLAPIPTDAAFVAVTVNFPASGSHRAYTRATFGWLLDQDAASYHILDEFAAEEHYPKAQTTLTPSSLAARAGELRKLREDEAHAVAQPGSVDLSRNGAFSGQFEPPQLRLPELLVGVWAYQRQDKVSAARVLLPRLEELADQRWMRQIGRDLLGHYYHQQMLSRWADYWDEAGARRLAKHLGSPLFAGFEYQYRAEDLLGQLSRSNNSPKLVLPTPGQWHAQRRGLSRAQQITFLADRLRLISCRQLGWPCDVNLRDEQRSIPVSGDIYTHADRNRGTEVINPYVELRAMTLEPAEIPLLIPRVADRDYLRTYHCWRPWHPGWQVFEVNELVEALINDAVGLRLADLGDYYAATDRPAYLAELTRQASKARPRLVRALSDGRALWQSPGDPILGILSLAGAGFWYRKRRALPVTAVFGSVLFASLGLIALWYPALAQQRVLLSLDTVPPIGAAVAGSVLAWQFMQIPWLRAAVGAAAVMAAVWLVERYVYLDPLVSAVDVTAALLLLWPLACMLRRSRKGWQWLLLASFGVLGALANRYLLEILCRWYHIRLTLDFEPPFLLSHAVWTLAVGLAFLGLLGYLRRHATDGSPRQGLPDSRGTAV